MSLVGLPDLGRPLTAGDSAAWRAYGRSEWLSLPHELQLAEDRWRRPDLFLSMYRPFAPDRGPAPFGQLRASFEARHDEVELLEAIRAQEAQASLHRALPAAGSLVLISTEDEDLAEEISGPFAAGAYGANGLRISRRLTPEGASFFAKMIEQGTMPISAELTLRFEGVAPRVPMTAAFAAQDLAEALAERIEDGVIGFPGFAALIEDALDELPVELVGLERDQDRFQIATALADRLALRFADPLASRDGSMTLATPDEVEPLQVSIDLSVPVRSARWITIASDPFAAMRGDTAAGRAQQHISRTEMRPIPTGGHRVRSFANLAMPVAGLERMGVVLRAPAMPPMRPHAISTTAMFEAEALEQTSDIHLAPGEEFDVTAQAFAIIQQGSSIRRVAGPEIAVEDTGSLMLNAADFGFQTATVEADHGVLMFGDVKLTARYVSDGREIEFDGELNVGRQATTIAVPLDAIDPRLHVRLVRHGGGPVIDLGERPLGHLSLSLPSLPSYGVHNVEVHCPGLEPGEFVAIDVAAADDELNPDRIETLTFSAETPRRSWRYFARDPFNPGFCWAPHIPGEVPFARWVCSAPVELLTIPKPEMAALANGQESARAPVPSRPLEMSVDFGNGANKRYTDVAISAEASIHDVLQASIAWEPPLACKVATLFTDRGGTDRNYLASVDGVEAHPRGNRHWSIEWDGKGVSLDRPGIWTPGGPPDPEPIDPSDLPTGVTSISLRLVEGRAE